MSLDGTHVKIRDLMNPPDMFENGERKREYTAKCLLPLSGRLIPEFDRRRSIKDMFSRKATSSVNKSDCSLSTLEGSSAVSSSKQPTLSESIPVSDEKKVTTDKSNIRKRCEQTDPAPCIAAKRSKVVTKPASGTSTSGQQTLRGFFKPKPTIEEDKDEEGERSGSPSKSKATSTSILPVMTNESTDTKPIIDPNTSKEDWSKLFTKKPTPKCEGHEEPCISFTTKKPGINCGRSFWVCARPLGPSGTKEKGTQWRCSTFIWASDWNPPSTM